MCEWTEKKCFELFLRPETPLLLEIWEHPWARTPQDCSFFAFDLISAGCREGLRLTLLRQHATLSDFRDRTACPVNNVVTYFRDTLFFSHLRAHSVSREKPDCNIILSLHKPLCKYYHDLTSKSCHGIPERSKHRCSLRDFLQCERKPVQ